MSALEAMGKFHVIGFDNELELNCRGCGGRVAVLGPGDTLELLIAMSVAHECSVIRTVRQV